MVLLDIQNKAAEGPGPKFIGKKIDIELIISSVMSTNET